MSLNNTNQALANSFSPNEERAIQSFESRLFSILDEKDNGVILSLLERIDVLKQNNRAKVVAILERVETDIENKYNISKYAVATGPTPVLYTSDFVAQFGGIDGQTLNFDDYGEIDAVEFVALAGTVFQIQRDLGNDIYKVTTKDYPVESALYVHGDFLDDKKRVEPLARSQKMPSKTEILERLRSVEGVDYVWGGNNPAGISRLLNIFPPKGEISDLTQSQWQLSGVDCSGLIYWATDGVTPRNTSWLIDYGTKLDIAGKSLEQIIPTLQPLDIIVWKGHMLVVLDAENTIESAVSYADSSLGAGVQIRKISDSLGEVMTKRTGVNDYSDSVENPFVIVRWYEES